MLPYIIMDLPIFVHLQMGDAKDRSPKKILKCDVDLEMGDAKESHRVKHLTTLIISQNVNE